MPKAGKINNVFYRDLEKKYPIIERAEGVYLYDDAGNRYLDFGSGIGVVNIGFGRTGKTFGIDHYDALPDMMVAGKGVGGGYTAVGGGDCQRQSV